MKHIPVFLAIFIGLGILEVKAQYIKRLGATFNYGSIIPHSSELKPLSQTYPRGISGILQVMDTDLEAWEVCNCFYYLGLKFSYDNFDNPDILGSAYSLTGTFEPILLQKEPWTFSLNSGIGFSYLSKIYDSETNPNNVFFSVHVNFLVFLAPKLEYRFDPDWSGQLSLSYKHISNGGQNQPNKGMNYPMIGVGINHYLSPEELPSYAGNKFSPTWGYYADAAYTSMEAEWASGRRPVVSLAAGAFRRLSTISALGGGLELNQDYSLEVQDYRWERLMVAPFLAHHFLFGRIEFIQRMALYLNKPSGYNSHLFYQRYILQYRAWRSLRLGMGLKVHGHVAENIDFRVGWRF